MAWKDVLKWGNKKEAPVVEKPVLKALTAGSAVLQEAAKGEVKDKKTKFSLEKGEPHPHDMALMCSLYNEVPIVHGAINKIVDHTVGPGFRVEVEKEAAKKLLEDFMRDLDFDNLLRKVVLDMLVYGNAFVEVVKEKGNITQLIPRSPETMFVERDKKGKVLKYLQVIPEKIGSEPIEFELNEIAHFRLVQSGDKAYGTSVIHPLEQVLTRKLALEKYTVMMARRRLQGYDVTVGDEDNPAEQEDVDMVNSDFESLEPDQEFVHNHLVKVNTLGFQGKTLELVPYLDYFENQIVYGLEVPLVLLGKGNVPEGLAVAQMETFERKINSIQLAVEKTLEPEILKNFLNNNGFADQTVEFEWKETTLEERKEEATLLLSALNSGKFGATSPEFMQEVEQRLADVLNFDGFEAPDRSELDATPPLPGQNAQPRKPVEDEDKKKDKQQEVKQYCLHESFNEELYDAPLREFVGFNYLEYLENIKSFISSKKFLKRTFDSFKYLPGTGQQEWEEIVASYSLRDNLTKKQVEQLRTVLKEGFEKGQSVRQIKNAVAEKVTPADLLVKVPPLKNKQGKILRHGYNLTIPSEQRSWALARTETIRGANQGALETFKGLNVKEVQWVATQDGRLCRFCEHKDGQRMGVDEADEMIPAHDMCRCTWVPLQE